VTDLLDFQYHDTTPYKPHRIMTPITTDTPTPTTPTGTPEMDTDTGTPDYDEYDGQPDEAQEWHDFDPDC
jgi:hypothetical protein